MLTANLEKGRGEKKSEREKQYQKINLSKFLLWASLIYSFLGGREEG